MKAPDKIYVKEFDEGISQMWSRVKATETSAIAQYEYIRKDALIEWASNRLGQVSDMGFDDGDVEHGYTRALQDIIDKINSL